MGNEIVNAYFAGLIDGEGTIGIYRFASGQVRPIVKVDMTSEKTITALHNYFGGYKGVKKVKEGNKPQWHWECTYTRAVEVCRQIHPYLIEKADRAEEVLKFIPNARGRKRSA